MAVEYCQAATFHFLQKQGAKVTWGSSRGITPSALALMQDRVYDVRQYAWDIEEMMEEMDFTPLHSAVAYEVQMPTTLLSSLSESINA